jgi:hypothetical protein
MKSCLTDRATFDYIMNLPRILIITNSRLNRMDSSGNGLLLRTLFGDSWPKDKLAQLYSGFDNCDEGFCGSYYKLSSRERRFGRIYYYFKSKFLSPNGRVKTVPIKSTPSRARNLIFRYLIDTGIYEFIFPVRLSKTLTNWVEKFEPDIILAQGYSLGYVDLARQLSTIYNIPLVALSTDDWPLYLYQGYFKEPKIFVWLMRKQVKKSANWFFKKSDLVFAFGPYMALEYTKRYQRSVITIDHLGETPQSPNLFVSKSRTQLVIATTGVFNAHRLPLLEDLICACDLLRSKGLNIQIKIYSDSLFSTNWQSHNRDLSVSLMRDPGQDLILERLMEADILFLPETFDACGARACHLSVSTKAHLYMRACRPIIVYGSVICGVQRYALDYKWALSVTAKSASCLSLQISNLCESSERREKLVHNALNCFQKNHDKTYIRKIFIEALNTIII